MYVLAGYVKLYWHYILIMSNNLGEVVHINQAILRSFSLNVNLTAAEIPFSLKFPEIPQQKIAVIWHIQETVVASDFRPTL